MPLDKKILSILKHYAADDISAMTAAYDIQQLKIPGYEDPSASEVILWSKAECFGIPTPTQEEAEAEAQAFLARHKAKH